MVRRLRSSNKRRFKRKLHGLRTAYEKGKLDYDAIERCLASYHGHLSHGHTHRMEKRTLGHLVLRRSLTVNNDNEAQK